jgi:hypothetical protein
MFWEGQAAAPEGHANAAVATRNNIATRIAGIEKSGLSAGCLDFYHNQVKINLRKLTLNSFTNRLKIDAKVEIASAVEGDSECEVAVEGKGDVAGEDEVAGDGAAEVDLEVAGDG